MSKPGQRGPFMDVTPPGRRAPSWIAKHRAPAPDVRSLRPAPIPKEFVDAVQAEMALSAARLDESVSLLRATRPPSEVPPSRAELTRNRRTRAPSAPALSRPPTKEPSSPLATEGLGTELSLDGLAAAMSAPPSAVTHALARNAHGAVPAADVADLGEQTSQALEALHQALDNLVHARGVVFETAAAQIAELAATIARRVISHELSVNPNIVRRLVDEGLRALEREDHVTVRIGNGFAAQQAALMQHIQGDSDQVEVVVDPTLSDFGCVVETEHGWVDESIEARLAALLQELRSDSGPA